MPHILTCKNCEKLFISKENDKLFCTRKCYMKYRTGRPRVSKIQEVIKPKPLKSARDIANEAVKVGMSYGEYVRKMGL